MSDEAEQTAEEVGPVVREILGDEHVPQHLQSRGGSQVSSFVLGLEESLVGSQPHHEDAFIDELYVCVRACVCVWVC